ncbi:MAG: serine acetyltransferase [Kordiimonadaceae bacterium]|nr:serine acetyltransferase [Kordiimonadaceae bacterium]
MSEVSAEIPDWSREKPRRFWDPGRRLLRAIRNYQALEQGNKGFFTKVAQKYWVLSHRFWSVVTGAEIDLKCNIGGGLLIPHPNGIVIHPATVIGPNCLIFQQVTLGTLTGGAPKVGGHVDIGCGAKILGEITLGDHSRVGANAVVLYDVAPNQTVVGIPATPVKAETK